MISASVDTRAVYHAIGACVICGVSVKADTSAARAGYNSCNSQVWSRHVWGYWLWSWGGFSVVLDAMQRVKVHGK